MSEPEINKMDMTNFTTIRIPTRHKLLWAVYNDWRETSTDELKDEVQDYGIETFNPSSDDLGHIYQLWAETAGEIAWSNLANQFHLTVEQVKSKLEE